MKEKLFTSESVSEGHPDKLCDQVSDAILDAVLAQDSKARVACETMVKSEEGSLGVVILGGEITTSANINYDEVVRKMYRGSVNPENEFCIIRGSNIKNIVHNNERFFPKNFLAKKKIGITVINEKNVDVNL